MARRMPKLKLFAYLAGPSGVAGLLFGGRRLVRCKPKLTVLACVVGKLSDCGVTFARFSRCKMKTETETICFFIAGPFGKAGLAFERPRRRQTHIEGQTVFIQGRRIVRNGPGI